MLLVSQTESTTSCPPLYLQHIDRWLSSDSESNKHRLDLAPEGEREEEREGGREEEREGGRKGGRE